MMIHTNLNSLRCRRIIRIRIGKENRNFPRTWRSLRLSHTTANNDAASMRTSTIAQSQPSSITSSQPIIQGSNTYKMDKIVRHGPNDACITINVGGKEFYTLRSTIASNPVLADHVVSAELNHDLLRNNTIFIDRDPEYFPILLKYLRNRVEYESMQSHVDKASLKKIVKSFIDLPSDPKVLRELYVEAVYYHMKDLQSMLKDTSVLVHMASVISKTTGANGNPFDWIIKFWSQLRAMLVATSVVGGGYIVAVQNEWNWILQRVGLRKRDRHTKSEIFE
jgi:hypothetical protein